MTSVIVEHRGVKIDIAPSEISEPIKEAIRGGWYELPESEALDRLVLDDDIVLELGAGCGFISTYVANQGRAKEIFAVEANPTLIPIIKRTHELNGAQVRVFNEMLGAGEGETQFHMHPDFWASRSNNKWDGAQTITVPQRGFRARLEAWQPSLLIMDIEGGELPLLRMGLPPCVNRVVLEVHGWAYGGPGLHEIMRLLCDYSFHYMPMASKGSVVCFKRLDS
ncbi:FkbM family methyltransferase [Devosia sp. 1566]|uniref:FkbM family methyltransferase n=1 Tax=Devosia sp. 1566 TaxID=2499144 RepID=UPI0013E3B5D1|nr:FkbM family methyltransferase [Devosia sp. 1566]